MSTPEFFLGSSYFENGKGGTAFRREFAHLWYFNTRKQNPTKTVIISEGGSAPPHYAGIDYVNLAADLGHCHDLIENRKPHQFSSWSTSMCALALLAYDAVLPFVYIEQDAFCFGPVVEQGFKDLGDGLMVFGQKHKSPPYMPCSQSFFIVAHAFIPTFVASYLALGGDRNRHNLGEHKFVRIEEKFGHQKCRRLSFGVDRCRPIPWEAPIYYAQQWSAEELEEAKRRGLI